MSSESQVERRKAEQLSKKWWLKTSQSWQKTWTYGFKKLNTFQRKQTQGNPHQDIPQSNFWRARHTNKNLRSIKKRLIYRGKTLQIRADFSSEAMKAKRKWRIFQNTKKKKKKPPNLQYSSTSVFLSTHYKTSSNGGSSNCHNFEAFMSINVTVRYLWQL